MKTPVYDALEPPPESVDEGASECLLLNTGAWHSEERLYEYMRGERSLQDGVPAGWVILPVGVLINIRRHVQELKRLRETNAEGRSDQDQVAGGCLGR